MTKKKEQDSETIGDFLSTRKNPERELTREEKAKNVLPQLRQRMAPVRVSLDDALKFVADAEKAEAQRRR